MVMKHCKKMPVGLSGTRDLVQCLTWSPVESSIGWASHYWRLRHIVLKCVASISSASASGIHLLPFLLFPLPSPFSPLTPTSSLPVREAVELAGVAVKAPIARCKASLCVYCKSSEMWRDVQPLTLAWLDDICFMHNLHLWLILI